MHLVLKRGENLLIFVVVYFGSRFLKHFTFCYSFILFSLLPSSTFSFNQSHMFSHGFAVFSENFENIKLNSPSILDHKILCINWVAVNPSVNDSSLAWLSKFPVNYGFLILLPFFFLCDCIQCQWSIRKLLLHS